MGINRTNPQSGPRSGRLKPKKTVLKKGKPKMSLEAWKKLSRKEREIEHHGTRFRAVKGKHGRGESERSSRGR
jgi:hypothetical protein